jgi:hypothetical protein
MPESPIPNLTDFTTEPAELEAWATKVQADPALLFPHPTPAQRNVVMACVQYAHTKAAAMRARLEGRIAVAQTFELLCDTIHTHLPEEHRW